MSIHTFRGCACLTACLLLAACASGPVENMRVPLIYRVDVQQGNIITQDMLAQLKPGMEKAKVRYIMGTPLVTDVFHADRWDYVYTLQPGDEGRAVQRRVSLYFSGDRLRRVAGNVRPAKGALAPRPRQDVTVDVPAGQDGGFFDDLLSGMGWGDNDDTKTGGSGDWADDLEVERKSGESLKKP
ncbi:MAG: outer membrane protein assembly factor BamE [Gammaproteobacteria bacterium]